MAVWSDGDGVWVGRLEGWGKARSVVVAVVMVGVRMGTGASGPASDPIMLHDLAAVVRMASTNNTHLRNLWLSAPHGRLSPWQQARALALREVSRELHAGRVVFVVYGESRF